MCSRATGHRVAAKCSSHWCEGQECNDASLHMSGESNLYFL